MHRLTPLGIALGLVVSSMASAEGWPSLASPLPRQGGGEKDAALVIGVESYLTLPPVKGAAEMARAWYGHLTTTLGLDPASVRFLLNQDAYRESIEHAADQVAKSVKPGGTLWVVFIGHGAPSEDGRDGELVGFDAQQSALSLYARSLGQRQLLTVLEKGAQRRTVFVVDACFSGRGSSGVLVPGLQPVVLLKEGFAGLKKPLVSLTAGRADQFAGPLPGAAVPAFSYLVLGGLRGWADADRNGDLTAHELVAYSNRVLAATLRDRAQNPEVAPADADAQVVAHVAKAEPEPPLNELVLWLSRGQGETAPTSGGSAPRPPEEPASARSGGATAGLPTELARIDELEQRGDFKSSVAGYDAFIHRSERDPAMGEWIVVAMRRKGDAWQHLGKKAEARAGWRQAVDEFDLRTLDPAKAPIAAEAAAASAFQLAELLVPDVEAARIGGSGKKLESSIKGRQVVTKRATTAFDEVTRFKAPEWTLAALYRKGWLMESMQAAFLNAPVPPEVTKLGDEAVAAYQDQLGVVSQPMEDKAIASYEEVLAKARELSVFNDWTRKTYDALKRMGRAAAPKTTSAPLAAATPAAQPAAAKREACAGGEPPPVGYVSQISALPASTPNAKEEVAHLATAALLRRLCTGDCAELSSSIVVWKVYADGDSVCGVAVLEESAFTKWKARHR